MLRGLVFDGLGVEAFSSPNFSGQELAALTVEILMHLVLLQELSHAIAQRPGVAVHMVAKELLQRFLWDLTEVF